MTKTFDALCGVLVLSSAIGALAAETSSISFDRLAANDPALSNVGVVSQYFPERGNYSLDFVCTAVLIGPRWALTTASCVNNHYIADSGRELYQLVFQSKPGAAEYRLLRQAIFPKCYFERKSFSSSNASVNFQNNPECNYALVELIEPIPGVSSLTLAPYSVEVQSACSIAHMDMEEYSGAWKSCGSRNNDPNLIILDPEYQSPVLAPFTMHSGPGFGGATVSNATGETVGLVTGGRLFGNLVRPDPITTVRTFDLTLLENVNAWISGKDGSDAEFLRFGWELGSHKITGKPKELQYTHQGKRVTAPILVRRTAQTRSIMTASFDLSPENRSGFVFNRVYTFDFSALPTLRDSEEELFELTFEVTHSKYWFFGEKEKAEIIAKMRPISTLRDYEYKANRKRIVVR